MSEALAEIPKVMPVADTGNGHKVRPDRQTKIVIFSGYALIVAIAGFLALQVWMLNGSQARQEEKFSAYKDTQDLWNARFERALEKLTDEFRAFKEEMLKRGDGSK